MRSLVAMQLRRGLCYRETVEGLVVERNKRKRARSLGLGRERAEPEAKRRRAAVAVAGDGSPDYFDTLPDDLVLSVLCRLGSSAGRPADLVAVLLTCRRFNRLGSNPMVLSKASAISLALRAYNWSESAHRFLKLCADAGNLEACYIVGMIRFYCLGIRGSGAALMARAAMGSHAAALYSLSVIQFNGSGGPKARRDLRAGVALCARAAFLGHVDAIRELGHCLQDGYGVRQNVSEGRRFLVMANARELAAVLVSPTAAAWLAARHLPPPADAAAVACQLLSDFGCSVPAPEAHPANRFLAEWFAARGGGAPGEEGRRLCSHAACGRPETRRHEFRRCSVCGAVNYCSRACQALDWKLAHKAQCVPMDRWLDGQHHPGDAPPDGAAVAEAN